MSLDDTGYVQDHKYYALIFNGKKNPSVPLDMGRYGAYAPHTVDYQIYRGEATDSC